MTDQTFVAPDTDDLDAFNDLMYGSAKPTPAPEPAPEADDEPDDVPEDVPSDIQDDEPEDELDAEPEPEPEPVKKKTAKERINELTAARKEAERLVEVEKAEKAALSARLADLEAKMNAATPPPVTPAADTDGPSPVATNEDGTLKYPLGEFDPQYIADLTRYTINKVSAEKEAQQKQVEAQKAAQEYNRALQESWQNKIAETEKTLPDFRTKSQELIGTFSTLAPDYSEFLAQTIMGLETGPEVLYHLANNPAEAKAIVDKGPLGAAIALGRLEARFIKSPEPKQPPRVSSAPKPAPATARGVSVGGQVPPDTDDLDAFSAAFFATRKRR